MDEYEFFPAQKETLQKMVAASEACGSPTYRWLKFGNRLIFDGSECSVIVSVADLEAFRGEGLIEFAEGDSGWGGTLRPGAAEAVRNDFRRPPRSGDGVLAPLDRAIADLLAAVSAALPPDLAADAEHELRAAAAELRRDKPDPRMLLQRAKAVGQRILWGIDAADGDARRLGQIGPTLAQLAAVIGSAARLPWAAP